MASTNEFYNGFKKISIQRCGVMPCGGPKIGARFEVCHNLQPLFPYLNARLENAKYFDSPKRIQFVLDGVQCTVYAFEVVAAAFYKEEEARSFAEKLLEYLNEILKNRIHITPDYGTVLQSSPMDIYRLLPKTNCKKCGHTSCLTFAAFLSRGKAKSSDCPGFTTPIAQKAVYPVFDSEGNLSSTVELNLPKRENHSTVPKGLLTKRELEVLKILANGGKNTAIAESLNISPHTVKTHVSHIYDKLGVNDRVQAAVWAVHHNLL